MKPIKFRAWNKKKQQMCNVLSIDFWDLTQSGEHIELCACQLVHKRKTEIVVIEDMELMQFTGMLDKNGGDELSTVSRGVTGFCIECEDDAKYSLEEIGSDLFADDCIAQQRGLRLPLGAKIHGKVLKFARKHGETLQIFPTSQKSAQYYAKCIQKYYGAGMIWDNMLKKTGFANRLPPKAKKRKDATCKSKQ